MKASVTQEVILYKSTKCTVTIEPSYRPQDIDALEQHALQCYVTSANRTNNDLTLTKGFFHSKIYNYIIVNEIYEMSVWAGGSGKNIYMHIQSTNLKNAASFSNREWAEKNADSIHEKNRCVML